MIRFGKDVGIIIRGNGSSCNLQGTLKMVLFLVTSTIKKKFVTIKGTVNLNIFGLFMKDVIVYDVYFTPIILVNKVAEDKKTHTS